MSRSLRAGLAGLFTVALILLAAGLSGADPEPKAPAPERGWLGVYMEARQAEGHGAVLLPVVVPGSPAERGGLCSGDLVLGLSEPFTAGQDTVLTAFRDHIATLHAGEALPLILRRTVTELRRGDGVFEDSPELPKLEALLADKALVKLEARRVQILEEAGVVWDPLAAEWERMHGLLLAFKEREGHCDVPRRHEEQGAKLGKWLSHQRQAYKRGTLEARRVQILEDCGVTWTIR